MSSTHRAEPSWPPFHREVGEWPTQRLLAIVLQAASVAQTDLHKLARAIDKGEMAALAAAPDDLPADVALPVSAAVALQASFVLARRAATSRVPMVIRGPEDVAAIARRELGGRSRECVLVVACDASNRLRRAVVTSKGALDRVPVPVREILNVVLRCDGRAFAIAHNHPCGDAELSDLDIAATRRVADAARIVGLRFLGHVVVGENSWMESPTSAPQTLG